MAGITGATTAAGVMEDTIGMDTDVVTVAIVINLP